MKSIYSVFNWTTLIALLAMFLLPFINNGSYFESFDKISIPLALGSYSLFWIIFKSRIERLERELLIQNHQERRLSDLHKATKESIVDRLNEIDCKINNMNVDLRKAKDNSKFIEYTMRVCVVCGAIIKLFQYFFACN